MFMLFPAANVAAFSDVLLQLFEFSHAFGTGENDGKAEAAAMMNGSLTPVA
ncbi:hypothetical protein [Pararhizobium sp.]|uniref:hypothetical protein n=1 Tax=Pararhizobium sp. TaxID=1977563 RepID=UPI00271BADD0|nr:hypothetical protein [Pararhizobium sp.]MDO9415134.1 hypothetical protein [Pararhizobium sp.]